MTETMSWGVELWDQYDQLALHTQKGIEFLERFGNFLRDRCAVEMEYAGRLRRLTKAYYPKKKDEEDFQYTPCKAFKQMLNELGDMAGQHEVISENLSAGVLNELNTLVKNLKEDRKKGLQEGQSLMHNLNTQIQALDRSKKIYEKAYKESVKSHENYVKADKDLNLSRAEIVRHQNTSHQKSQQSDSCKHDYANQLKKVNDLQQTHYKEDMPKVFNRLQELDEKRIKSINNFMVQAVTVERNVYPIINKCLDGIVKAAESIDPAKDSKLVMERYKSGFVPPGDIPFEDLGKHDDSNSSNNISISSSNLRPETTTLKGTISTGKLRRRGGLFGLFSSGKNNSLNLETKEDYNDLPPNQRKKKIQQKIDEISSKIRQEKLTREALLKMKGVYEQTPTLGDPTSIEGQLCENDTALKKLQQELQKYQSLLNESDSSVTVIPNNVKDTRRTSKSHTLNGTATRTSVNSHRSSVSDESLSRSASDSSVSNSNNNKRSAPGTPLPSHGSSHSPESGIGTSHTSLPDSEEPPVETVDLDEEDGEFYYDTEQLPVVGTCRAMYPFDAQSEGAIPMDEGEELYVIEIDQGDGWTRVRRLDSFEEGFVPTSYIHCTLYNNC